MGSSNQVLEALKEKKDSRKSSRKEKFRNHIVEVTKTRKTIEAFSAEKSKSGSSRKEPFPEASQRKHQQRWRVAGHQAPTIKTTDKEEEDMVRLNKHSHLRIVSDVTLVLEENLKVVHPIVK